MFMQADQPRDIGPWAAKLGHYLQCERSWRAGELAGCRKARGLNELPRSLRAQLDPVPNNERIFLDHDFIQEFCHKQQYAFVRLNDGRKQLFPGSSWVGQYKVGRVTTQYWGDLQLRANFLWGRVFFFLFYQGNRLPPNQKPPRTMRPCFKPTKPLCADC